MNLKIQFNNIAQLYLDCIFRGPVYIFGERNPVFTAPDPVSAETGWELSVG